MLMELNGQAYFTPQVRSKFIIEQHDTWFILEIETVR